MLSRKYCERSPIPPWPIYRYFFSRRGRVAILLMGFALGWLQLVTLTWTKSIIPRVTTMGGSASANADFWLLGSIRGIWPKPSLSPVGNVIDAFYAFWVLILKLRCSSSPGPPFRAQIPHPPHVFSNNDVCRSCRSVLASFRRADFLVSPRFRSPLRCTSERSTYSSGCRIPLEKIPRR